MPKPRNKRGPPKRGINKTKLSLMRKGGFRRVRSDQQPFVFAPKTSFSVEIVKVLTASIVSWSLKVSEIHAAVIKRYGLDASKAFTYQFTGFNVRCSAKTSTGSSITSNVILQVVDPLNATQLLESMEDRSSAPNPAGMSYTYSDSCKSRSITATSSNVIASISTTVNTGETASVVLRVNGVYNINYVLSGSNKFATGTPRPSDGLESEEED